MAWWTDSNLQLKSKSSFRFLIGGMVIANVKSASKPKANVDIQEYRLLNHYYKYPGLVKWDPIDVTLVDVYLTHKPDEKVEDLEKDERWQTTAALWSMLRRSGYKPPSIIGTTDQSKDFTPFMSTPEKASFMSETFSNQFVVLEHIDIVSGDVLEKWELHNPLISKFDWGDYEYGSDDPVTLSLTIDYDYATYVGRSELNIDKK